MGWVWVDEAEDTQSHDAGDLDGSNPRSDEKCFTRKIIKSRCATEEVEPGKFVRKCDKTEQILRDCVGRPSEVVQSNKEYTEEDVSDQVKQGYFPQESSELQPFNLPGLRSDIEAIERSFLDSFSRFFEAAEEMKNGFFSVFDFPRLYDKDSDSCSSSMGRGMPIEGHSPEEPSPIQSNHESGDVNISGLARDV